jgi:hypothetical protein
MTSPRTGDRTDPTTAPSARAGDVARIGATVLALGGVAWAAGMTALAIVRPGLDSNLFYAPFLGGMLIGIGVAPFALGTVVAPVSTVGRVGAGIAAIAGGAMLVGLLGDLAHVDGLQSLVLPGLLIVLLGLLIFGIALALPESSRRMLGVFITAGLVASLVLFPGPDPTGAGLFLKAAAQGLAALSFGLGCAALAWQELGGDVA